MTALEPLFRHYSRELAYICLTHAPADNADVRLAEEEVVVGQPENIRRVHGCENWVNDASSPPAENEPRTRIFGVAIFGGTRLPNERRTSEACIVEHGGG